MSYISSNANRWYCGLEAGYGQAPTITAKNRMPAVKLKARQQLEGTDRKDKTGSRTFAGNPAGTRHSTKFDLSTYMTAWLDPSAAPGYGPLFQATFGATPASFAGGTAGSGSSAAAVSFTGLHGLTTNQAITHAGEIRFVASVVDPSNILLNAPFSTTPQAGSTIGPTVSYAPALELPSVSIFDYWSPATAVQRLLCGAAVDKLNIHVNGDYHEFQFSGIAQDIVDSASFADTEGGLSNFPVEPPFSSFDYTIIPGHLGQVWLGTLPTRFLTLTEASIQIDNDLDARTHEFGSALPRLISPGRRKVTIDFEIFEQDDSVTQELYQAARQQSPISVMLQLGQLNGQLFGVYMKSVVPQVPEFDDGERRVQWRFQSSRAQGSVDDEIVVAFG